MAQEDNATQPAEQAIDTSNQPEVQRPKNLDTEEAVEENTSPEVIDTGDDTERSQNEGNEEMLNLLKEQKDTIDDLKKGLYEQGNRIAQETKTETSEVTDEEASADQALTDMGYIKEDTLKAAIQGLQKEQKDANALDALCNANPNIDRKLLETLGNAEKDKALEDIVEHYNLNRGETLSKANSRPVKGMPIPKEEDKQTPINKMTDEEFTEHIRKNSSGRMHSNYI